mmetsp:Transcript_2086/g.2957  ORF Transcript_2086/g.2957 Transcript_2086/m.2957 type:complete len:443 (+) Transcript_2086:101-1429(+)
MIHNRHTYVLLASSSVAVVVFEVLRWRARLRAQIAADRAKRLVEDGPLINTSDLDVQKRILSKGTRRAEKWMSYLNPEDATPMKGQVGGISFGKRQVLTLKPDYVLKPIRADSRGVREVAFYEALGLATKSGHARGSSNFIAWGAEQKGENRNLDTKYAMIENTDAIAMWMAIFVQDEIVAKLEKSVMTSRRSLRKEMEILHRLSNYTPSYYGIVGQRYIENHEDGQLENFLSSSYLLLSDATVNFVKPCVMDLKMGQQTFEPDAPMDKREREQSKYPQQELFGMRLVGMRIYDPAHPEADNAGFRTFDKHYGRSLKTREDVLSAFGTFFQGSDRSSEQQQQNETDTTRQLRVRAMSQLRTQLHIISRWFEENKAFAFYSSSLLIVFEGDNNAASRDVVNLKMIDFGHVRRQAKGDPGYLYGLRFVMGVFKELQESTTNKQI